MVARKSNLFIIYTVLNITALLFIFAHAHFERQRVTPTIEAKAALVERLQLTDLCLFTDARYTRNPAVADFNTPFQDSPMSMEHFPSGTIILPPPHLRYR